MEQSTGAFISIEFVGLGSISVQNLFDLVMPACSAIPSSHCNSCLKTATAKPFRRSIESDFQCTTDSKSKTLPTQTSLEGMRTRIGNDGANFRKSPPHLYIDETDLSFPVDPTAQEP
jgi:hypothetical protein